MQAAPAPAPVTVPPQFDAAYLRNPPPAYPALARRYREQGKVLLRVYVSAAGAPRRAPGGGDVPIPNAPAGALIGRVDNGQPFVIGRNTSVRMPASGTLFLGINDDNVSDNRGDFRVLLAR